MTELVFRSCEPSDDDELLRQHRRLFVAQWSREWWDWRYRTLPLEHAAILGAFDTDGLCRGMYAGVQIPFQLDGKVGLALSQSDVFVDPEHRGGHGPTKLLTQLGQRFNAMFGEPNSHITYGYPVPPLRRVVTRHMDGKILCDVVFLIHDLHATGAPPEDVRVAAVDRPGADHDELWSTLSPTLPTALIRDAAYYNWRYGQHPVDYQIVEARDKNTGRLRGTAVLREGGLDDSIASLSDWLVPEDDSAAESALVHYALEYARKRERTGLVAWFSSSGSHFHRFQVRHQFFARATSYQQLFYTWVDGIDRDWMQREWYQTMGDIDFF